jgi:hypothetical protein
LEAEDYLEFWTAASRGEVDMGGDDGCGVKPEPLVETRESGDRI